MNKQVKKELVPELRFPEFQNTGEWKKEKLGSLLDYLQPTKYLVSGTAYKDTYATPVLTAGKTFILGYTNETDGIYSDNLPVIIFDDFTTSSKYVDFPFKAKSSAMKILVAKNNNNIKFVYEIMQNLQYAVGVHERHWISIFSKLKVPVPKDIKEQQKIADCLSSLDELIAAHTQKHEALQAYKKGLLQNLFPAVGKTMPKLRFPEFKKTGDWACKSLADKNVSTFIKKRVPLSDVSIDTYVSTRDIVANFGGVMKASKMPLSGSFTAYKCGDILIANIRPYLKKVWVADKNGGASNDVIVIRPKENNNFLSFVLRNEEFISYVMQGAKGVKMPRGDIALIKKYPVTIPKSEEQFKIVSVLLPIDDLITTEAKKIEELNRHKKGLIQQLFPTMEEVVI